MAAAAYQPIIDVAPGPRRVRAGGPASSSESGSRMNESIAVVQGGTLRTITHVPILVSDDIIAGSLTEAGRMS